jgi:hypothetical protein
MAFTDLFKINKFKKEINYLKEQLLDEQTLNGEKINQLEKENTELADIVHDEIIELDEFSVETLLKILNELAKFN